MTLLPIQLKHVLDALPAGWVKPKRLEIASAGAPMPEELRRIALRSLASRVTDIYGSNEIGTIAITRLPDRGGIARSAPMSTSKSSTMPTGRWRTVSPAGSGSAIRVASAATWMIRP
ncbi:MAG: hypothetical protein WDN69_31530 [Aliidongia sp.]